MNERIILVTSVGGDIGQSVIRCLKDTCSNYNFHIIGCDMDKYSANRNEIDEFLHSPPAVNEQIYLKFIRTILSEKNIDYVLFLSEPEILLFNKNRDLFKDLKAKILVNDKYITDVFTDKYNTYMFLKKNSLPCPETFLTKEFNSQLQFPLMVKQRRGYGAKGLVKVNSQEELDYYVKIYRDDIILQEFLPDGTGEYTVGVFGDGVNVFSIAFRRQLGYGSLTKIAELVIDRDLEEIANKIAKSCNLKGSINVQLKKKKQFYVPLEINPRFSSTVYFRSYFGFKDVLWWIDLLEGKAVEYNLKYKKGTAVRKLSEVFFDLELR